MPRQSWNSGVPVDEPLLDQLVREPHLAGVEDLQLRLDAELLDARRHGAQLDGRDHGDVVAVAEVHAAAVERADLGQQLLDVLEPLEGRDHVAAGAAATVGWASSTTRSPPMPVVRLMMTSVGALADALDDLAVVLEPPRGRAGLRVAHVDVRDGRAGARPPRCAASAICCGVTGRSGCMPAVSPAPVTAQVMMTSSFTAPPPSVVARALETRPCAPLGARDSSARPSSQAASTATLAATAAVQQRGGVHADAGARELLGGAAHGGVLVEVVLLERRHEPVVEELLLGHEVVEDVAGVLTRGLDVRIGALVLGRDVGHVRGHVEELVAAQVRLAHDGLVRLGDVVLEADVLLEAERLAHGRRLRGSCRRPPSWTG